MSTRTQTLEDAVARAAARFQESESILREMWTSGGMPVYAPGITGFSGTEVPLAEDLLSSILEAYLGAFGSEHISEIAGRLPRTGHREATGGRSAGEDYLTDVQRAESARAEGYMARLVELKEISQEEGIQFSEESEQDFWAFVNSRRTVEDGDIFVTDEGHVRFVWRGERGDHLAIRFFGDGWVRYVVFKVRLEASSGQVSRIVGDDTLMGMLNAVETFGFALFLA